jgi:uncharacterized protein YbjT (DUF2867 family)
MPDVIAVLGATGRTGGATARHLLARGTTVRAITRDPDSAPARALALAGAEIWTAEMSNVETMRHALRGATRLYNVQPAFDGRGRHDRQLELAQGRAVATAAAAAQVGHVVQLAAGYGRRTGVAHLDTKLEIRTSFQDAGLPVSYLCPAPFMELMVDPSFAPAISTWGAEPRIIGWDHPKPWVAVDDVGRVAADLLTTPPPRESHEVSVSGDVRSLRDCREILTHLGLAPRRLPFPVPEWAFKAVSGGELPAMWRWIAQSEAVITSDDLLDVPTWAARLADRVTADATATEGDR